MLPPWKEEEADKIFREAGLLGNIGGGREDGLVGKVDEGRVAAGMEGALGTKSSCEGEGLDNWGGGKGKGNEGENKIEGKGEN